MVDVGICQDGVCHQDVEEFSSDCQAESTSCCGPVSHSIQHAVCGDGNIVTLYIIKECGCVSCLDRPVLIKGKLSTTGDAPSSTRIFSNGEYIDMVASDGEFSFEVSRETRRLPLMFTDLSNTLVNSIVVVEVRMTTWILPIDSFMVQPTSSYHDSNTDILLDLELSSSYLTVPSGSFYSQNGQIFQVRYIKNTSATVRYHMHRLKFFV